jgi:hypothetical protein
VPKIRTLTLITATQHIPILKLTYSRLATPSYPTLYIVYSEVLAEAAARLGNPRVTGIVGEVIPDHLEVPDYFEGRIKDGINVSVEPNKLFNAKNKLARKAISDQFWCLKPKVGASRRVNEVSEVPAVLL